MPKKKASKKGRKTKKLSQLGRYSKQVKSSGKLSGDLIALLKEVIKKIAGKNTEEIVPILIGKKNINEFKIAEKLKLTINQARNILYKINAFDIVSFTRKKDKRKGWYIYFWTLDELKALHALRKIKEQEIAELDKILESRRQKRFFVCNVDSIELNEETAMHHEFLCPECGELLQLADNEKKINEVINKIEYVKRELAKIISQIEMLTPKPIVKKEKVKKVKKAKKAEAKKVIKKTKKKAKKKGKGKKVKPKKVERKKSAKKAKKGKKKR